MNLTVSAPKETLGEEGAALPVMVYVHGGALKEGGGHVSDLHGGLFYRVWIWKFICLCQINTTRMVDLSVREGHPVIIVSIQ